MPAAAWHDLINLSQTIFRRGEKQQMRYLRSLIVGKCCHIQSRRRRRRLWTETHLLTLPFAEQIRLSAPPDRHVPWPDRLQLDDTLEIADKSDDIEVNSDGWEFSMPTLAGKLLLNTVERDRGRTPDK